MSLQDKACRQVCAMPVPACLCSWKLICGVCLFLTMLVHTRAENTEIECCRKLKMSPQFDPLKPLMIPFGTDR